MLALMLNIVQFAYWNVGKKRKFMVRDGQKVPSNHWYKYRPVYLLLVASVCVCTQPVCMLVIGSWNCDGQFTSSQIQSMAWDKSTGVYVDSDTKLAVGYYGHDGTFDFFAPTKNGMASYPKGLASGSGAPSHLVQRGSEEYKKLAKTYISAATDVYYVDGCDPDMHNFFFDGGDSNYINPNTTVGWCIQIFGTYLGFILMFWGVCQATMLHVKIYNKWGALRSNGAPSDGKASQV